ERGVDGELVVVGVDDADRADALAAALPVPGEHPGRADGFGGDATPVDVDDLAGLVPAKARLALGVDGVLHARAPAQGALLPGERFDREPFESSGVEPAEAGELVDQDAGLEIGRASGRVKGYAAVCAGAR